MSVAPLRVMAVMPHQDDFEFTMGGTLAILRKTCGDAAALHVLCTSRGASGHHQLSPDETFAVRQREAAESAARVGASYECLRQLDGAHVEMQVLLTREVLGGLWNAVRAFEPDVLFCPPVVTDPLAGVHVDHLHTAEAVRLIAYQIGVPNAYPTMGGPRKTRVHIPLILNVDDSYTGECGFHIRQDIREAYDTKLAMARCHRSQILEWLPWMGGSERPFTPEEFAQDFHQRHEKLNARYGRPDGVASEYFRITRWGRAPKPGELARLFPRCIENRFDTAALPPDSEM